LNTKFRNDIDLYLTDKTADEDRDYSYLHPSEFGNCPMQTWLKMTGAKQLVPFNSTQIRIFDNGHFIHLRNQVYAKQAGVLAKDRIVKKDDIIPIKIGLEERNKIRIEGESGREYFYSPGEFMWKVENKKDENLLYLGTDLAPNWDIVENLKEGDEWWLVEVPVVNTEYHFGGHCDAIVIDENNEEVVIDYKGINDYSWPYIFYNKENAEEYLSNGRYKLKWPDSFNSCCFICGENMKKAKELSEHMNKNHLDEVNVDFKYKIQLHIYMMILGLNNSILWYENKNNQSVIDAKVERDEKIISKIKKGSKMLWDKIINNNNPDRPKGYNRKSFPCSYCDFSSQCWNI